MEITLDIDDLLSGAGCERLETWAALARLTPCEYVRACVRRRHLELKAEVKKRSVNLKPITDGACFLQKSTWRFSSRIDVSINASTSSKRVLKAVTSRATPWSHRPP